LDSIGFGAAVFLCGFLLEEGCIPEHYKGIIETERRGFLLWQII